MFEMLQNIGVRVVKYDFGMDMQEIMTGIK
jgi:hypothetical protein